MQSLKTYILNLHFSLSKISTQLSHMLILFHFHLLMLNHIFFNNNLMHHDNDLIVNSLQQIIYKLILNIQSFYHKIHKHKKVLLNFIHTFSKILMKPLASKLTYKEEPLNVETYSVFLKSTFENILKQSNTFSP